MKAPRRLLVESIRGLLGSGRQIDMAARLRVHVKGPRGAHHPPAPLAAYDWTEHCPDRFQCYTLPRIYGGRWDKLVGEYERPHPPDLRVVEFSTHPGQLPALLFDEPGVKDILFLGAPRGGKTLGLVVGGALDCLEWPRVQGGMVAPTNPRLVILWADSLNLLSSVGWVERKLTEDEIFLQNGASQKFVAAQPASRNLGPPLQGFTWAWCKVDERQNVPDDSFREALLRGASYGDAYRVKCSATNQEIAPFQRALEEYRSNPRKKLIPVPGKLNSFIAAETWEDFRLAGNWSEEDYNRIINAEIIPAEGLIYSGFDYDGTIPKVTPVRQDITEQLTYERTGDKGFPWIIGHDFGWQVNASVVMKAFADGNDRVWFVFDELLTRGLSAAEHARDLIALMRKRYSVGPEALYVIGDPHTNKPDTDDSDYAQFRKAGLKTIKARHGNIDVKHRFSMVNALLRDAAGRRRLFVARDANGHPRCPKLVESFKSYCYSPNGKPEQYGKDSRRDPSHPTDALGYGLFPWEKIRGSMQALPVEEPARRWRPGMGGFPVQ